MIPIPLRLKEWKDEKLLKFSSVPGFEKNPFIILPEILIPLRLKE